MSNYLVTVHYQFKGNTEEKAVQILEKEVFPLLLKGKCTGVELFQDENNPSHYFYEAHWNSLADAHGVQKEWDEKSQKLKDLCTNKPQREFFKTSYTDKARKAA